MGEEAYNALKPRYTKLEVKVGRSAVFEDIDCSRPVFKVLKDRISDTQDEGNFQFNPRVQAILQ